MSLLRVGNRSQRIGAFAAIDDAPRGFGVQERNLRGKQMMYRYLTLLALLASILTPAPALAQQAASYMVPRTEYGQPDLQGVWGTDFVTPLERPANVDYLVASPDQAQAVVRAIRALIP